MFPVRLLQFDLNLGLHGSPCWTAHHLSQVHASLKRISSERLPAELCALLPGEPLRSLSFSASAHLQIRAHLSPLPPGCSRCSLDYTLCTAMQSVESLSGSTWGRAPGSPPGRACLPTNAPRALHHLRRQHPALPQTTVVPTALAMCGWEGRVGLSGHATLLAPGAGDRWYYHLAVLGVLTPWEQQGHARDQSLGPGSSWTCCLYPPNLCTLPAHPGPFPFLSNPPSWIPYPPFF